jgi:NADH-quinone oxidoreductase subunit B
MDKRKKDILNLDAYAAKLRNRAELACVDEPSALARFPFIERILDFCRANSLWPLTFGLSCCAIEMMSAGMARFDIARYGSEVFRPSPRQADLMIVAGTVNKKMADVLVTLYEQMPSPKWVIALGNCAVSGGPFAGEDNYYVIEGVDKLIPVDVYVPGCPPRPEGLIEGILKLQEKITGRRHPFPQNKHESGTAHV